MGDGPSNELAWSAPPAPEMFRTIAPQSVGYLVERASSASGPWQTLNGVPVTAEGFQDATPPAVGETFYRVLAASADGTVSEPAGPVSITRALAPVTGSAATPATPVDTRTPLLTLDDQSVAVVPASGAAVDAVPGGESVLFGGAELYSFGGGSAGLVFGTETAPAATGDGTAAASPSPSATEAASDGLVIGSAEDDAAADDTARSKLDKDDTTDAAAARTSSPLADGGIAVIAAVTLLALLGLALASRRRHRGGPTAPPPAE